MFLFVLQYTSVYFLVHWMECASMCLCFCSVIKQSDTSEFHASILSTVNITAS